MTVYISGPMTGYAENNYPAFFKAEELLSDETVVSPTKSTSLNRGTGLIAVDMLPSC